MSSGNGNRHLIILHKLTKQFCAGKHRKILTLCFHEFRVILVDCCRINNNIDTVNNIFRFLSIENSSSIVNKM